MNALVIYDSKFGNTRKIAEAIGQTLQERCAVQVLPSPEATPIPTDIDLLVIGGPTQAHGASPGVKALLATINPRSLPNVPAATFDTRFDKPRWITGSDAAVIAKRLRRAGCTMVLPPESFFVEHAEGPLAPGELERAHTWAQDLLAAVPVAGQQAARR
jgi:flavodoxin